MTVPNISSSADLQSDFLNLLITQLQNQNPLDPMNTNDMSGQLAQFSQLEQLENMNSRFGDVLGTLQRNYATNLVGKEVSYATSDDENNNSVASGTVSGVSMGNDDISLLVGNQQISLADILSIGD